MSRTPILYRNRNPAGVRMRLLYGLAELVDGIVRVLSLGFLATTLPMAASKIMARQANTRLRRRKAQDNQEPNK